MAKTNKTKPATIPEVLGMVAKGDAQLPAGIGDNLLPGFSNLAGINPSYASLPEQINSLVTSNRESNAGKILFTNPEEVMQIRNLLAMLTQQAKQNSELMNFKNFADQLKYNNDYFGNLKL